MTKKAPHLSALAALGLMGALAITAIANGAPVTGAKPPTPGSAVIPKAKPAPPTSGISPAGREVTFIGMCDASGAVALDDRRFAVANDEDNVVRIYDAEQGGAPLFGQDLSPELPLRKQGAKGARAKPRKDPESDIEAATELNGTAYWLTSHGRDSKGMMKPARFIVFATNLPKAGEPLKVVGRPYTALLSDFVAAEGLRDLGLAAASERAPKQEGALNVEGLTAMADGSGMFIGFRNPVPKGRALLVPWLNPREVMDGKSARLGAPILLDLGGQGVRSLSWWRGQYLVVGGHYADGGQSHLYTWDGRGTARRITSVDFTSFNPEGFFTAEGRDQILVMSDDGNVAHGGTPCKDLEDSAQKRFRGRWLEVADAETASRK